MIHKGWRVFKPQHNQSIKILLIVWFYNSFSMILKENRIPLKLVLGAVYSLTNYIAVYEET